MTRGRRILLRVGLAFCAVLVLFAAWVYFTLESEWFFDQVRTRIIATVEKATGGRVELAAFRFDRSHFTAEVRGLVLHGTEAAGRPPLFRAASVKVGLKLLSVVKPSVDVLSLDVAEPHVNLTIAPDGKTNIPEPKVKRTGGRNVLESILDVAADRFRIHDGFFDIDGQGKTPIDFEGRNLAIQLAYDAAGPRYKGTLHVDPMNVRLEDYDPQPFSTDLALTIEPNRIAIDSGRLTTSLTTVDVRGSLVDLAAPHAAFEYVVRTSLTDVARIFRVPELKHGTGLSAGTGAWSPADGLTLRGDLHGSGGEYLDNTVHLGGFRVDGAVEIAKGVVGARGLRVAGFYLRGQRHEPLEGRIGALEIRKRDIDAGDVALVLLGGTFTGQAQVRDLEQFLVDGEIAGIQAARTVALYSPQKLPWDALVYGSVRVRGAFHHDRDLRAGAEVTLAPASGSEAVRGRVTAAWDASAQTLDLGRSAVELPHSRAEFSGAIGTQLRVHLESTDLNDLLPVLGGDASALPVRLNRGSALFDGTVTGNLALPRIAGHVRATGIEYAGEAADAVEGDVTAAPESVRVQNGLISRGALRAQVQGSVVLSDWKLTDASPVAGSASVRGGAVQDLLAIAGAGVKASGTLNGTAYVSGTAGAPRAEADLEIVRGTVEGEPLDRLTAHARYTGHTIEVTQAQITAGPKQVRLTTAYDYAAPRLDQGRLRFDVTTNAMPLEAIHLLQEQRDDLGGTVEAHVSGEAAVDAKARTVWRVVALHADVSGRRLEMAGQPVGDARFTAQSQGNVLRAHLESTAAGADVRGDGEWRLEGDYPGTAKITFSKLDLINLRAWISSGNTQKIAGSADGELLIEGPALDRKASRAELRIPRLEIGPAPDTEISSEALRVNNQGPIVARYANSVITLDNVHLVGRGTDLTAGGRIAIDQKQALDLRVDGHADLSFLGDFVTDLNARGAVVTNATIRGSLSDPQVTGRMEFQKASFNIADVPNGISNATGVVAFNRDRATIQTLTGETGGGKIDLSGFVQFGGGPLVFRLHARAREVRVRYPEGVSTMANANLNLTGTEEASTLSGNVTVLRAGINLQSDFSSILARSAEPVRTPSAQTGILGGMSFDIQIETAPETEFQSSLTEGIQAEAALRLRGTLTNPAVLGRVTISQGKLTFFGTQYTVNQGTVNFYNPVKIEPILNIDLETKARGIDITLSVSGPLNKMTLTPRSDPPLQFSEIVALLAQGRTPTSDPSLIRRQTEAPQTFQQAGATALLGSAIANPVAGRLQRFFGVSKLRIDPSLSGVENNPQARLTVEQQVTPNVTFTYITNVTTSNPQVVRMEWAISKEWSAVALREENGLVGLDFFYKKRLK